MKKNYLTLCLGILFSASSLHAQLNGVYTIDNTVPVSATNFTSFTQFASTLNVQGVSGPVTVNVGTTSGPYNEQIEIIQYAGASATNSVVINGNGRTITFNATNTALRHTILLSGADYMTWNNLRVIGTNGTSALVVHLWGGADNNTFNDMYIEAPFNGTSTTQVPFSISGGSVAATTIGNGGSYNVVNTSTMVGGYYATVIYGSSTFPFNTDNEVRNSNLRDFYLYGFLNAYCTGSKVIGNLIERLNRTTVSTTYGIMLSTNSANSLVEGNYIRNLFNGITTNSSTTYAIYVSGKGTSSTPNIIRNNVVSDINNSGTLYGMYLLSSDYAYAEHNTISLDDPSNTSGTTYGIYSSGANNRVRNNNISISRAGTGVKYGLFYTAAATNLVSDYNNVYIGSTSGTNYFGSFINTYNTLSAWQTGTGYDLNSVSADPQYANPAAYDYAPTNLAVNNIALPTGLTYDILGAARSPLAPDPGAYEIFILPCATAPPANFFTVPSTSVCPGTPLELTLLNTGSYTNSGYVVQWYSSTTSTVGPFQAIPGATLNTFYTAPTTNIHYNAVVTCIHSNHSSTTTPGSVIMVPIVQDTVPYFESFEAFAQNGLPNCYWTSTNYNSGTSASTSPASGNRAARTGSGYAYFESSPPYLNHFYTNQILLQSGITYSAALWYITENIGFNQWTDLSILVGTSQQPNGLQHVASVSPVSGQLYNLLSNTFTVPATGYYYVAVRATGSVGTAPFLTWDDLSITIPCSLNSPTLSVLAPTVDVCQGLPATLQAIGADTYSWSNGVQGSINVVTPLTHSTYIVYGTNVLSGCASSETINLTVQPSPVVSAIASSYSVCAGQTTTLSATGADSYYWSTGSASPVTVVSPATSSLYIVAGYNLAGCTASAQVYVQVSPAPMMNAAATKSVICRGESVQLSAQGAGSYVWLAPSLYSTSSLVTVTPQSSTMYTVTGSTESGCSVTSQVIVLVESCTDIAKNTRNDFRIFPNPATNQLFIQSDDDHATIVITDVSGRVVATQVATSELTNIPLTNLSAGVYYVRLHSNNYDRTEMFIKQ